VREKATGPPTGGMAEEEKGKYSKTNLPYSVKCKVFQIYY